VENDWVRLVIEVTTPIHSTKESVHRSSAGIGTRTLTRKFTRWPVEWTQACLSRFDAGLDYDDLANAREALCVSKRTREEG
jgi:hypothetical protein